MARTLNMDGFAYLRDGKTPIEQTDFTKPPLKVSCPTCRAEYDGRRPFRHYTYAELIADALTPMDDAEKNMKAADRYKAAKLLDKVMQGGDVEFEDDEIVRIKDAASKFYSNTQVFLQIYALCEGDEPKSPPANRLSKALAQTEANGTQV